MFHSLCSSPNLVVVRSPVVRRIVRITRIGRARGRDLVPAQREAHDADPELPQLEDTLGERALVVVAQPGVVLDPMRAVEEAAAWPADRTSSAAVTSVVLSTNLVFVIC